MTAPPRCPNCASLEAQNNELDRKLAEMEQAEPVAVVGTQVDVWRGCDGRWAPPGEPIKTALMLKDMPVGTMLYAAPPKRQPLTEQVDLSRCPQCNGPADNGHDRSIPPNPYLCTKCMAEPVQEPVAWLYEAGTDRTLHWQKPPLYGTPLYTAPPQRQPLSGLEVERLLEQVIGSLPAARNLVRAVERAHGIIESEIKGDSHQTLDDAMQQPRAMAQAYEGGYKAGAAAERKRIIQFLTEMQRQVGDGHNHYGVAAMRIRERV